MTRMTASEIRSQREYLGLTIETLAAFLQVNPRTVRSWDQGRDPIPERVTSEMAAAARFAEIALEALVAHLRTMERPEIEVYRTDDEMVIARHAGAHYGARWLRHLAARAQEQVPAASIVYSDERPWSTKRRPRTPPQREVSGGVVLPVGGKGGRSGSGAAQRAADARQSEM